MKLRTFLIVLISIACSSLYGQKQISNENVFTPVTNGAILLIDLNGDNHKDILINGFNGVFDNTGYNLISEVHINDCYGSYYKSDDFTFPEVHQSTLSSHDFNNDGNEEILITGYTNDHKSITKLFYTDGHGTWFESKHDFLGIHNSSVALLDINNDDFTDIILTGSHQDEIRTIVYSNIEGKEFKIDTINSLPNISTGSIITDDLNNDGYVDVILNGFSNLEKPITDVYINKQGRFQKESTNIKGSYWGGACLVKYNEEKHLVISGYDGNDNQIGMLFSYNNGTFTLIDSSQIEQNRHGSMVTTDINNDGYDDFFHFGQNEAKEFNSKLYINKGAGNFYVSPANDFEGIASGFVMFFDFDQDGKKDIVCSGYNGDSRVFLIYKNLGDNIFKEHIRNQERK